MCVVGPLKTSGRNAFLFYAPLHINLFLAGVGQFTHSGVIYAYLNT